MSLFLTCARSVGAGLSAASMAAVALWPTLVSQPGAVGSSSHRPPGSPGVGGTEQSAGRT